MSPFIAATQVDAETSSADLLMMQATMAINQILLEHLQQFDLGRLKIAKFTMLFTQSLRERARDQQEETAASQTMPLLFHSSIPA